MAKGVLVLLGSGETTPGMVKVHRALLAGLAEVRAVNLDTSYGFQENVEQMTAKLVDYFETSLHTRLEPLHFPSFEDATALERALVKRRVREATYVFAGPGSPSYALAQWSPLGLRDDLADVLGAGGVVCFASAAAVTLGVATAPIYEIYKAGTSPHWLGGLDLTAVAGLSCVVIPHYDNAEGATHDTRFCYLGERRLLELEAQLDPGVATLGVDEHTALILDLEADSATVTGRAHAYWRVAGDARILANGSTTPLSELRGARAAARETSAVTSPPDLGLATTPEELAEIAASARPESTDALARLVLLAGNGSHSGLDAAPLVEAVLAARSAARTRGDYAWSDTLRDLLVSAGVTINDGPEGSTWSYPGSSR